MYLVLEKTIKGEKTLFKEKLSLGLKKHVITRDYYFLAGSIPAVVIADADELQSIDIKNLPKEGIKIVKTQTIAMFFDENEKFHVFIDGIKYADSMDNLFKNEGIEFSKFISHNFSKSNRFDGVILHFTNLLY